MFLKSSLIKKAEDTDADTAELSAIKLRAQQQTSNALVATDQRPANGAPQVSQLGMVMIPSTSDAVRTPHTGNLWTFFKTKTKRQMFVFCSG